MEHRIRLRIREKIRETAQATTLVLEPVDAAMFYQAGQFITLIFNHLSAKPFRRSYSFSSTPGVDELATITVKKIPNGSATHYLVDRTQVGDVLEAIEPAGQFVLPPNDGLPRDLFLIGGGSGVTPLFSILKYVLHFEPQSRVVLILANSNEHTILFRRQLHQLALQFSETFQAFYFLSNTLESVSGLRQAEAPIEIRVERLSNALVGQLVTSQVRFAPKNARFFLCGPKNLMLKASQMLHYLQFSTAQIRQEHFTIVAPYRPPQERYGDSLVQVLYRGQDFLIPLKGGQTILEAAEALGIDLPYSCRSGSCTACTGRCTSGKVEMFTQQGTLTTDWSDGVVFTCVGYPLTDTVRIVLER